MRAPEEVVGAAAAVAAAGDDSTLTGDGVGFGAACCGCCLVSGVGCDLDGDGGAGASGLAAVVAVAVAVAPFFTLKRTSPTLTLSCGFPIVSVRTPPTGDLTSAVTLSVSIWQTISSSSTGSPIFLSQVLIVPELMESPMLGTLTTISSPSVE